MEGSGSAARLTGVSMGGVGARERGRGFGGVPLGSHNNLIANHRNNSHIQ